MVLISHNHYDHLDKSTILKLESLYSPLFIVPLGVDHLLSKWNCKNIVTLDWWDKHSFEGIEITSIPANHFSARGLFDRDKTLWCGYQVKNAEFNIYFAGDTGYSDVFKEIGKTLKEPDISLIPIGAYKPEWFMSPVHISPKKAIKVHLDVKSKQSIAMHFGTFPLADDNRERDLNEFEIAKKEAKIDDDSFIIPMEGKPIIYKK
jgi:L-ascorbate metabolism protein UlaG (beta-lactamase superfamily)